MTIYWKISPMLALLTFVLISCSESQKPASTTNKNDTELSSHFDEQLAEKVGADDYGMKKYVMAFLKSGPHRDQDSTRAAELQQGHMENINRLAGEGKLVLAGPFLDDGDLRGIFIFDVETIEEARELVLSDPAVQAGRLEMELRPWYGSAALMNVNEIHQTISKTNP